MKFANTETVEASYKDFNDGSTAWGSGRYMNQQCGKTWRQTFSQINQLYHSGRQLPYLQPVMGNDYEEAMEIESGIDNCFLREASMSGNTLAGSANGDHNAVDHYHVHTSPDGQNVTQLTQTQPGVHSVDLCSVPLSSGQRRWFVHAVGKPTLANRNAGAGELCGGVGQPNS